MTIIPSRLLSCLPGRLPALLGGSGLALAALLAAGPLTAQTAPAPAAATPPPVAAPQPPPVDPATFPAVVATVNGTNITKDDLLKAVQAFTTRPGQRPNPSPQLPKQLYMEMLEQLINLRVLLDDAAKRGVAATPAEVQAEIDNMTKRMESPAKLDEMLAKEGMTRELLNREIQESITVRKLVAQEIAPKISVSDADTKAYYDGNQKTFARKEQYRVSHILIKLDREPTAEQKAAARKKADELRAQLVGGADFATLAKEHSDDTGSKERGGELPWLSVGDTMPPFEKAALAVKAGELSEIVETPFGFHIIKGIDRQPAGTVPYDQAKARITEFLTGQRTQGAVVDYAKSLRPAAKVVIKL